MRASALCKSCNEPVRWAIHATTGRRMPLDPEATPDGNIAVVGWDDTTGGMPTPIVKVNAPEGEPVTEYRYVSHFATCPDAAAHRRRA
jgi:hypothetical protein